MLLIFRRKFGKIAAPAPDADNQVAVFFRVGDGVFKHRSVKDIQLQLLVAEFDEIFYQAGQFLMPSSDLKTDGESSMVIGPPFIIRE